MIANGKHEDELFVHQREKPFRAAMHFGIRQVLDLAAPTKARPVQQDLLETALHKPVEKSTALVIEQVSVEGLSRQMFTEARSGGSPILPQRLQQGFECTECGSRISFWAVM